ncbi:MAG: hypothetical protein RR444_13375, partial [Oscillospiraceae bacterium]
HKEWILRPLVLFSLITTQATVYPHQFVNGICCRLLKSYMVSCCAKGGGLSMQKEKILSELYHGNINPIAKSVVQGSAYQKAMHRLCSLEEKLAAQLDVEQQKLLQDFITAQGELNYISGEEKGDKSSTLYTITL